MRAQRSRLRQLKRARTSDRGGTELLPDRTDRVVSAPHSDQPRILAPVSSSPRYYLVAEPNSLRGRAMPPRCTAVLQHVHRLMRTEQARLRDDRQLLEQFLRFNEESAFAELVRRHGPLVLGVCR